MICVPGTYGTAHTRLFDGLRALCLRRVRQNAWRGFRRYLEAEHGKEMVEYTLVYKRRKDGKARQQRARRKRKRSSTGSATSSTRATSLLPRENGMRAIYGAASAPMQRTIQVASWTTNPLRLRNKSHGTKKTAKKKIGKRSPAKSLARDLEIGRDCLARLADCSWWIWEAGSALMFWRWPRAHRKAIRDGTPIFFKREEFPHFWKKQRWPLDEHTRTKMTEKIQKVRDRGYVLPGDVLSLTSYFAVPKGDSDVRLVYDATACGLNAALWAPNFFLPTIDSIMRNADGGTWFGDIDLADMFLNYFLDEAVRPFAGVDVRAVSGTAQQERWERCLMGLRSSPFICTQTFAWGEALICGDRKARDNPLRWDRVVMNLPGSESYNPSMPWVYRWDDEKEAMAAFFGTYIDDIRSGGPTEQACWKTSRRIASRINYLG